MNYTRLVRSFLFVLSIVAGLCVQPHAQSGLTLLSPNPITEPLTKIIASFEAKTGTHVTVTYGTGVTTRQSVAKGEALDVSLLFAPFADALKTGNVRADSGTVVARLRLGMAVRRGAPKPDISNAAAVKRALLNARSIAAIDPAQGSAGGAAEAMLEHLGMAEEVKGKIHWLRNARMVQDSVAQGENEIAIGPYYSEMRGENLDVVGPLPPDASTPVDITGFLSTSVSDAQAARALLNYLKGPEAAQIWEEAKVFPVR